MKKKTEKAVSTGLVLQRWKAVLSVAAFLIMLTIPACGASSGSGASDSAAWSNSMPGEEAVQEAGVYEEAAETDMGSGSETAALDENAVSDRKLIKNVSMAVETEDYTGLVSNIQSRVEELGGYTESFEAYNESSVGSRSASLTLRIPADRLDEFVSQVEEISNIVSRQETVEDVTLTYVDLESRRRMYEEEEDRLLSLLEQAETLEEIIALESRLTEVRYQLESMESQLRTMDNQVNYSTVYLSIDEVERYTPPAEKGTWERIRTGFTENVYRVGNGIKEFFIGFVISLPILLVLAVGIIIAVIVIRLFLRISAKNNAKRAAGKRNAGPYYGSFGGPGGPQHAGPGNIRPENVGPAAGPGSPEDGQSIQRAPAPSVQQPQTPNNQKTDKERPNGS